MSNKDGVLNEKLNPSLSVGDGSSEESSYTLSDILYVSPQGWAFLSILLVMGLFYQFNPFKKFIVSSLKAERYLYTFILVLFIVEVTLFYVYDPFNLLSWSGILTPILITMGVFLLAILLWYLLQFTDGDIYQSAVPERPNKVVSFFIKMLLFLSTIGLVGLVVGWAVLNSDKLSGPSYVIALLLNIFIVLAFLGFAYKIVSKSSLLQESPYTRLVLNAIFYIPCMIVDLIDFLVRIYQHEKNNTTKRVLVISGVIIVLCVAYLLVPPLINWVRRARVGGKIYVTNPVPTTKKMIVATYTQLNDIPQDEVYITYEYNYALSFWFYMNPSPGHVKHSHNVFTPICDYGGKPTIWYNGNLNTLMVTTKLAELTEDRIKNAHLELDTEGNVIIYKQENVLLQRWNNVMLNFDKGNLDLFLNGDLVKSVKNMVPYMEMDTLSVGYPSGANGSVCNVAYYNYSLDAININMLYNSVKSSDPPVIPEPSIIGNLFGTK